MRGRRIIMVILGGLALVAIVRHPTATIEIQTHDAGDPAPHRMQAAVDLGFAAFNLLLTWTGHAR